MAPNARSAAPGEGGSPIKPRCDELSYRILTLSNGLRAVLTSDPETDKAAAALDVRVGSMLDPPELQGLAHFLEHMLFYASEKYPLEDEYSKFISDHGGHTNAFTAAEDTNYQFDVNADSLEPALDRFAQFFIAPIISADGVEREIKAVDSEHGKNLVADAWRQHQLGKHTANGAHPYAKFFTGNLETLMTAPTAAGVDVRARVAEFHREHYSANLMRLSVYGRESLDELEAMARSKFSGIANRDLPVPTFPEDVFLPEHLCRLLRVVPVREGHVLQLDWDIPPTDSLYKQAPSNYLSHLLGHEGEGSAFALLKARGWASALSAGESGNSISSRGFFYVRIDLTDAGHANVQEVVRVVLQYLRLLRGPGGVSKEVWDEMRALQELRFHWRDKLPPYSYVTSLSMGLQHYADEHLLLGIYNVPTEYDAACIHELLRHMTPDRLRLYWASKAFAPEAGAEGAAAAGEGAAATGGGKGAAGECGAEEGAPAAAAAAAAGARGEAVCPAGEPAGGGAAACGKEPWRSEPIYGTRFCLERLPAEWLDSWNDESQPEPRELHMPEPNPFIPTDFSLRPETPGPKRPARITIAAPPAGAEGEEGEEECGCCCGGGRLALFHRAELRFKAPKAVVYLDFQCPEAYASPETSVLTRLAVKLLSYELNEVTYPADLAGLSFSASNTLTGFQIVASGYSHKLPTLVSTLVGRLAAFKVDPERFAVVREALAKEYANVRFGQPYQWALYRLDMLLNYRRWRVEQYEAVVGSPAATAEALSGHLPRLMGRMFTESLVVGNVDQAEARGVVEGALSALESKWGAAAVWQGQEKDLRVIQVPAGVTSVLVEDSPNPKDDNSAVAVLYQVGPDDLRSNALAALLVQLGKRDAFNVLRTQEQLGYVVSMFLSQELGVHGVALVLQSDKHSAAHLASRAEAFVRQLLARLEDLPESEFASGVDELSKAKLEKPKRLGELAQRWWNEIYKGTLRFDRQEEEVAALRQLTRADLAAFARRVLAPAAPRRKLIVMVRGGAERRAARAPAAGGEPAAGGAAAPAAEAAPAPRSTAAESRAAAAAALGEGERLSLIRDAAAWKRGCELYAAAQPAAAAGGAAAAGAAAAAAASAGAPGGGEGAGGEGPAVS